jgi:hypothetical protein
MVEESGMENSGNMTGAETEIEVKADTAIRI